jgi:hypothetical protein
MGSKVQVLWAQRFRVQGSKVQGRFFDLTFLAGQQLFYENSHAGLIAYGMSIQLLNP